MIYVTKGWPQSYTKLQEVKGPLLEGKNAAKPYQSSVVSDAFDDFIW